MRKRYKWIPIIRGKNVVKGTENFYLKPTRNVEGQMHIYRTFKSLVPEAKLSE